jgi:dCMP deaminase
MAKLSDAAKKLLARYKCKHNSTVYRPSWDERWLSEAFLAARRSHDAQTKCGAALVKNNELITVGYNGWPRNIPFTTERMMPNMRPEKYPWMIHAEANAIYNAARQGKSTVDTIMYCTGEPCFACTLAMWQAGIKEVRYASNHAHMTSASDEYSVMIELFHFFTHGSMEFIELNIDTQALQESIDHIEKSKNKVDD